jgi:hypothetical protein
VAIERELLDLARQTDVIHVPAYQPIPPQKLLEDLNNVTSALSYLTEGDRALYYGAQPDDTVIINADFHVAPETIEALLTREALTSTSKMILKVKRPDYLGQSQWDFRHDKRAVTAKITDTVWLKRFQSRQEDVRPGDSLRVEMTTEVKYGYGNEVVGTSWQPYKCFRTEWGTNPGLTVCSCNPGCFFFVGLRRTASSRRCNLSWKAWGSVSV